MSATGDTDFDFNDVVIDVKYGSPAKIKIMAAGGTLPLRICENDSWEVHELFHVDQDFMVNTNAPAKGLKGNSDRDIDPVELTLDINVNSAADAKNIIIEVQKNGVWQEMTAEQGEPAAKIAVETTYDWLDERTSIKAEHETFVEWATNNSNIKWW